MILFFFVNQLLEVLRFRRRNILQAMLPLVREAVVESRALIETSIEVLNLAYFPTLVRVAQQRLPLLERIIQQILFSFSSLDDSQCDIVQFITERIFLLFLDILLFILIEAFPHAHIFIVFVIRIGWKLLFNCLTCVS